MYHTRRLLVLFTVTPLLAPLFSLAASAQTAPEADVRAEPIVASRPVLETTAQIMKRSILEQQKGNQLRIRHAPEEREIERDEYVRPNPYALPDLTSPGGIARPMFQAQPRLPQAVSTKFLATTLRDSVGGAFPPDTMGAAGPSQFLLCTNGVFRLFDKAGVVVKNGSGTAVLNTTPETFFASVKSPTANTFVSDPHVRYDRLTGRWFIVLIDVPGGSGNGNNRILMAVSDGPTITSSTVWSFTYFANGSAQAGDSGFFADYPTLGIDNNALYIGVNNFDTTSFRGCTGFVVRKSSITTNGASPTVFAFRNLCTYNPTTGLVTADGPYTPQGVDNFDPNATEGYFAGVSLQYYGKMFVCRVANVATTPTITKLPLNTAMFQSPVTVPHKGQTIPTGHPLSDGNIDPVDERLLAAVVRNGHLWTAHNISVNSTGVSPTAIAGDRDAIRWYDISGVATGQTLAVNQYGTVYDTAATNPLHYLMPTLMVNGQGHIAMGSSVAGVNSYINGAAMGRLATDAPANAMQAPTLLTTATAAYNPPEDPDYTFQSGGPRRWGDYSYTCVDPMDDMTMWTVQQYTYAANNYGVMVAKLLAPPPATPLTAVPATLSAGQSNVNIAITGAAVSGSGFFDPGANPPAGPAFNHINVSFGTADVTVNSVTYTDPTHITANISIPANAATGVRTITVTNPDGQAVSSATAIFTVTAGTTLPYTVLDVNNALRIAAGLSSAQSADKSRLDVVTTGVSANTVDMLDAVRVARKAAGLDTNP